MDLKRRAVRIVSQIAHYAASFYIAGEEAADAVRIYRTYSPLGWKGAIGPWNKLGDSPRQVLSMYETALLEIVRQQIDCYLSIKFPALGYDVGILTHLLSIAREQEIRLHLDSLDLESADRTMKALSAVSRDFDNIGCTLPSRWRRSGRDAESVQERGLYVRMVKGQWQDPSFHSDSSSAFIALAKTFLHSSCRIEIATHDLRLAQCCLGLLSEGKVDCSLGQLYGLPSIVAEAAKACGGRTCIYIPFGEGYLPYAVSQIRRNPQTLWWLLRDTARCASGVSRIIGNPG